MCHRLHRVIIVLVIASLYIGIQGCQEPLVSSLNVSDKDGDGYTALDGDCDDSKSEVNPDAYETCNELDDDCNGVLDEGVTNLYYRDADRDGYGAGASTTGGCKAPVGYVDNNADCDDSDAQVYPGAFEVCDAADKDHNCNGKPDGEEAVDRKLYYEDKDSDGFGSEDPADALRDCTQPDGHVTNNTDCNDFDPTTYPFSQAEDEITITYGDQIIDLCDGKDNNCNNVVDDGFDADGDNTPDCFGIETCDGLDNNQNGVVDEGYDLDGDGYFPIDECSCRSNYEYCGKDCDDSNRNISPRAVELCDGVDNDCDGVSDEVADNNQGNAPTWYIDSDSDGYGSPSTSLATISCSQPEGYVSNSTDCDDSNELRSPGSPEICDREDNNCNDVSDEGLSYSLYYVDYDDDGYGIDRTKDSPESSDPNQPVVVYDCHRPAGYQLNELDCNDGDDSINPDATEMCDELDNNCDGLFDDPENSADVKPFHEDADSDGFGNRDSVLNVCYLPDGYVLRPASDLQYDCDDTNDEIFPGGTEQCDGLDNNCNGKVDDQVEYLFYFPDSDDDSYGDFSQPGILSCTEPDDLDNYIGLYTDAETGITYIDDGENDHVYSQDDQDCDDSESLVHPFAVELCNHIDDNCDGLIDESSAADTVDWYIDSDYDSFGNQAISTRSCAYLRPTGYVEARVDFSPPFDCDDSSVYVNPLAVELCDDHIDNNCNGSVDEASAADAKVWYRDLDSDSFGNPDSSTIACYQPGGYVSNGNDCNDNVSSMNPGFGEICDGYDNDCDGLVDEASASDALVWYMDSDNDLYGNPAVMVGACSKPTGYVANKTDCDDSNSGANPSMSELCDSANVDEDCDGLSDDNDGSVVVASTTLYFIDSDQDQFGSASATAIYRCDNPSTSTIKYSTLNTDCNDSVASINPLAQEVAGDSVDQNCDGHELCYVDADGDGYRPDAATTVLSSDRDCFDSGEATSEALVGDCNDLNSNISPVIAEVAGDGVDQNCDGVELCYRDADDDGYRENMTATILSSDLDCTDLGEAEPGDPFGDCNDSISSINPGAAEIVGDETDQDCDSGEVCYRDSDDDGYRPTGGSTVLSGDKDCQDAGEASRDTLSGDCNDSSSTVYPGADEVIADAIDQDCDGKERCFQDSDDDGYRPNTTATIVSLDADCGDASEAVSGDPVGDCNDNDTSVSPAKAEVVGDEIDQNCDSGEVCFLDGDDDGYRPTASATTISVDADCSDSREAVMSDPIGDCNDSSASVYPSASELIADSIDQDCDGKETCYGDVDNDGFRPPSMFVVVSADSDCNDSGEAIASDPATDCDDLSVSVNPSASEIKGDEIDQNCDGGEICFIDADGDGYRSAGVTTVISSDEDCQDSGEASSIDPTGDCNDGSASVYVGAAESCDSVDNDCDGVVDDAVSTLYYADQDSDSYGDPESSISACSLPSGYVTNQKDCDDSSSAVYLGAPESCNGIDDNCDGVVDDNVKTTFYLDNDLDGFGDSGSSVQSCSSPAGYVLSSTDCDDSDPDINPAADESCDLVDENCDGLIDDVSSPVYDDVDGDGYGDESTESSVCVPGYIADGADCDDLDASVYPGAVEECNGADDDCDLVSDEGLLSTFFEDADGDSFGTGSVSIEACTSPSGYVDNEEDCDDGDENSYPGATDICSDSIDSDCDEDGGCQVSVDDPAVDSRVAGADLDDHIGFSLSSGDFDGDGEDDLVIGAPLMDDGASSDVGAVYVLLGPLPPSIDLGNLGSVAHTRFVGANTNDRFGFDVSTGDFDGDGIDDLLVGAPGANGSGTAYLFAGSASADGDYDVVDAEHSFVGESNGDECGFAVSLSADVDGDGRNDVVVGSPSFDSPPNNNIGRAYVALSSMSLPLSVDLALSEAVIAGSVANGRLGHSVSGVSDIDGDTFDEVVVGAVGAFSNAGGAYLFAGRSTAAWSATVTPDATFVGSLAGSQTGFQVTDVGDISGDGNPDIAISAPYADLTSSNEGIVYVVFDPFSASSYPLSGADVAIQGSSAGGLVGYSVASAGDVNGDGTNDLAIGAPGRDTASGPASPSVLGRAHVFFGPIGASSSLSFASADAAVSGAVAGDGLGWSVSSILIGSGEGSGLAIGQPPASPPSTVGRGVVVVINGDF